MHVAERHALFADNLIILMTLAGQQHDVTGLSALHCPLDRGGAIGFDMHRRRRRARENFSDDRRRLFAARIVAGDDDAIGVLHGDGTHLRAFSAIAIAAATEHAPELPLAVTT